MNPPPVKPFYYIKYSNPFSILTPLLLSFSIHCFLFYYTFSTCRRICVLVSRYETLTNWWNAVPDLKLLLISTFSYIRSLIPYKQFWDVLNNGNPILLRINEYHVKAHLNSLTLNFSNNYLLHPINFISLIKKYQNNFIHIN